MNKTSAGTIIRTVGVWLAIGNQILTATGKNPLPIDDNIVTTLITAGFAIWAWWKNNSFTPHAKLADEFLKEAKKGEK
ncbi:phage holin [Lactococcus kimchii]|uniref:phage holin n=1 Tax=Lactococcus sp. S-13 TaxID=2507158 RepID=UPI00102359B7|nr:phage holin [Lactococcus sp. S-13]RZI47977.1 phage holin [Lactococcus sp. S-13]RZI48772.1 phage holin [Lactococcus sp. S-13]